MINKHTESNDQRQEYRLGANETVYIELDGGSDGPRILLSRASDLSANGLQVALEQSLPVGNIYSLCVQLNHPEVRFVLAGEVKWCRPHEGGFRLGIALFESDDTAILAWKTEIAHRLAASDEERAD
ncbi:MAG TPA: PilZ domain-containing protein [Cellvibrionaceae bacterium]